MGARERLQRTTRSLGSTVGGAVGASARLGRGFWDGLRRPLRGARFVYLEHPGLVRIWIVPVLLTFLFFALGFWWALTQHEALAAWIWPAPRGEAWWQIPLRWLHTLYEWVVLLLLLLCGMLLGVLLSSIFAAPFNDALSERVEGLVTGRPPPPFCWSALLRGVLSTVALEVFKLAIYLLVMAPLWLLSLLLPIAGPLLSSVAGFLFSAAYFALDYLDYAAARSGWPARRRFGLLRRHPARMLGFGVGVWGLLFVPVLNLFFMPAAVTAGTLLFLEMQGEEAEGHQ